MRPGSSDGNDAKSHPMGFANSFDLKKSGERNDGSVQNSREAYLDSESMGGSSVRGKPKSNPKTEPETKPEIKPETKSEPTLMDRLRDCCCCFGSGKDNSKKPDEHQKDDPKVGSDDAADNGVKESEEL